MKGKFRLHPTTQTQYHAGFSFVKESEPATQRRSNNHLGRQAATQALSALFDNEDEKNFDIDHGIFGQPIVRHKKHHNVQVSISHSAEYAAALAFPEEIPMAIDIEKINPARLAALRQWTTEVEQAALDQALAVQAQAAPFITWTSKEALSKILRTGLDIDFHLLQLEQITTIGPTIISTFKHFPQYQSFSQIKNNLACSIVLPSILTPDLTSFWSALAS